MFDIASLAQALSTGLWTEMYDPRFWFVFAVALIGGVVRGFSGFGGALIVVPLTAMALGPVAAVPMFYLVDLGSATPYGFRAVPKCKWRQVLPMLAGHLAMLPTGAWLLTNINPTGLRWGMEAAVVAMLALLLSGWRYTGRPNPFLSVGVGATAGIMGSTAGIPAPPIIAYWLGQKEKAAEIRTNIMAYYALSSSATDVVFFWRGMFTWQILLYATAAWPAYAFGLWAGVKLFHRTNDAFFRNAALALIAISAIIGAPIMDKLLK